MSSCASSIVGRFVVLLVGEGKLSCNHLFELRSSLRVALIFSSCAHLFIVLNDLEVFPLLLALCEY
jgi:hypothetical protein